MRLARLKGLPAVCAAAAAWTATGEEQRAMGVTQPPESVFAMPPESIVPALAGATPTGENGRVGGELVFWGYALADGRPVWFFACAPVRDIDCAERIQAICPSGTTVIEEGLHGGTIVERRCRELATAHPGEIRPGCVDTDSELELVVGLASCS